MAKPGKEPNHHADKTAEICKFITNTIDNAQLLRNAFNVVVAIICKSMLNIYLLL